jgi:hypothetical protein
MDDLIQEFKTLNASCEQASVITYLFEGEKVYAFADGICIADGGVNIYNEQCEKICFLGGIAGFTDCDGVNFFQVAEEIDRIWVNTD